MRSKIISIGASLLIMAWAVPSACFAQDPPNFQCYFPMNLCTGTTVFNYKSWHELSPCLWYTFCHDSDKSFRISILGGSGTLFEGTTCDERSVRCGDDSTITAVPVLIDDDPRGTYLLRVSPSYNAVDFTIIIDGLVSGDCCSPPPVWDCAHCLGGLSPVPGKAYLLTAWASLEELPVGAMEVVGPSITVECPEGVTLGTWTASGPVIDGWQQIRAEFLMPSNDPDALRIILGSTSGNALFDDVRIQPRSASAVSYVYDPVTLRLAAMLDDRHFATIYDYDGEGKLVRTKKETERGVMTIQETRYNSAKRQTP
ncbi:MAG: hypothetical protein QM724_13385 [Flavobacteriales bacterium]